ncbi:hypothetical protein [Neolewinella sp.]|uniref:hypothetical protein n=1 Tax=Neolewinella sp. TaxID=2993543 RepID=UPI003B52B290
MRGHTPYNYKWLTVGDYTELKLSVFMLDIPGNCEDAKLYGESIEAELVYLVRKQTGHWPAGQNEIHFNNDHPKNARLRAREMYDVMVT